MTAKKINKLIAFLLFVTMLLALNPFQAMSSPIVKNIGISVSTAGNYAVVWGSIVTADKTNYVRRFDITIEYKTETGWTRQWYGKVSVVVPSNTSSGAFSFNTPQLPNGPYSVKSYTDSGDASSNRVVFNLPGYYGNYPYYPQFNTPSHYPDYYYLQYGKYAGYPVVCTSSVTDVSDTSAKVEIEVTSNGFSPVISRGVVYSSNNSSPTLGNGVSVAIGGSTGYGAAVLNNLSCNTKYYVRAYATNSFGTSYGEVKPFTTTYDESIIATNGVMVTGPNSVSVSGFIHNPFNYTIKERGFVYSDTVSMPNISHKRISELCEATPNGAYSSELKGIKQDATYYVRAYIKTSNGSIFYGKPVPFNISLPKNVYYPENSYHYNNASYPIGENKINIIFVGTDKKELSSQTILASQGQVLSRTDLSLPAGYSLQNPMWQYRVIADASVPVAIAEGKEESNFMPVEGGFMFKPDELITRIDVAAVLYNLSNKEIRGIPAEYPDVNNNYRKIAVDYVSSNNYMTGYEDGKFLPAGSVTRADIAVIICNFYNLTGSPQITFTDVDQDYQNYHYIALATEAGLMNPYADGSFQPDNEITRAEATVIFSIAENRSLVPITTVGFSDVFENHWAYKYIMNAATPIQ